MVTNRTLARATYALTGLAARVKTYQRFYEWSSDDSLPMDERFTFAGRHWTSCTLTYKLLALSEHLDPKHWDHWALVHDECGDCTGRECSTCGGVLCPDAAQ